MACNRGKAFNGFCIDKDVKKRFKIKCVELEIHQSDILEELIVIWLRLKSRQDAREVKIYKFQKETLK